MPAPVSYNTVRSESAPMTREAVRDGFERFVDHAMDATAETFDVGRALRNGTRGPGGALVERLLNDSGTLQRQVVQPELEFYHERTLRQFDVVLDYAAGDAAIDAYRSELLDADPYADAIRADLSAGQKEQVRDRLVERQRRLGDAVAPLVASSETDFRDAVRAELAREEAAALVEDHFAFTRPLREHRDAFRLTTRFDAGDVLGGLVGTLGSFPTVEVTYTDEALRAMRRAEDAVVDRTLDELDRIYG